jgi:hypothetical protein
VGSGQRVDLGRVDGAQRRAGHGWRIVVQIDYSQQIALTQEIERTYFGGAAGSRQQSSAERYFGEAQGVVTPHVDRAYPLDRTLEAFEDKEGGAGRVRGKIAIVVIP